MLASIELFRFDMKLGGVKLKGLFSMFDYSLGERKLENV